MDTKMFVELPVNLGNSKGELRGSYDVYSADHFSISIGFRKTLDKNFAMHISISTS